MTDVILMKVGGGMLAPADERSKEVVAKWKLGEGVRAVVRRMRNLGHHRKFFALVSVVAENSDIFNNTNKALVAVKIAAGHVEWVTNPVTNQFIPIPKSISFANMPQDEFNLFYDHAITAVLEQLLRTMDRISIDRAVDAVLGFA
jgi:hypothetical protein